LVFTFAFAFAEEEVEVKTDTNETINIRKLDEKSIEKYLNDKDFDYSYELAQAPISLWDRIWNWLMEKLASLFGRSFNVPEVRFVFVVLILILIVFLLLRTEIGKLFFTNKKRAGIDYEIEKEDIRKLDIDQIIVEAISQKNYRKAVRYLYLKLLKELDKKELISWTFNKTNFDYAQELKKKELQSDFKLLSKYYEYIWYGDFQINENRFQGIHEKYLQTFKSF